MVGKQAVNVANSFLRHRPPIFEALRAVPTHNPTLLLSAHYEPVSPRTKQQIGVEKKVRQRVLAKLPHHENDIDRPLPMTLTFLGSQVPLQSSPDPKSSECSGDHHMRVMV